jgi:hypothetical protein
MGCFRGGVEGSGVNGRSVNRSSGGNGRSGQTVSEQEGVSRFEGQCSGHRG